MNIDIERVKKEFLRRGSLGFSMSDDLIAGFEQQQKEIEKLNKSIAQAVFTTAKLRDMIQERDEVIRGMIDEYGHHIGFDATGKFFKSKRKTFALDKAREILNIKGDSDANR